MKNNKKYLIALDMDGTLLNKERVISKNTSEYLKKLVQLGHKVVISSGRPFRAIKPFYEELSLDTPAICYNGSYIFNFEEYKDKKIPAKVIREIVQELGEDNCNNIFCENESDIYALKEDSMLDFFWKNGMNMHIGSLKNIDKDMYIAIIMLKTGEYEEKLVNLGRKYDGIDVRFWTDANHIAELYFTEHSKGAALLKVAKHYDIPASDIICFGDASNDFPMFEVAGLSVAMKNGSDETKKQADMVSLDDNDNDGIMKTLKHILNCEEQ